MIFYRDGYPFDSAVSQVIHGTTFPPHFFDTPAAREHWGITEQPIFNMVEDTIDETVSEPAILNEVVSKNTKKKGK